MASAAKPAPKQAPKNRKQDEGVDSTEQESNDYEEIDESLHLGSNGEFSAQPMNAPTQLHQPTMI